jgi:hypothetical protein
VRGRHQAAGAGLGQLDDFGRLVQVGGHRLLDQHVLAGLQRGAGDFAVLLHRGQHQHQVHVGHFQQVLVAGGEALHAMLGADPFAARLVDIAGGHGLGPPAQAHVVGQSQVFL